MDRLPSAAAPLDPVGPQGDAVPSASRALWAARGGDVRRRTTQEDQDADRRRVVAHGNPSTTTDPSTGAPQRGHPIDDRLIDPSLLLNYSAFAVRAVRRHVLGAIVTCIMTVAATAGVVSIYPKKYQIDARLLVQQRDTVSSLVNPDRAAPPPGSAATVAAQEIVHSRDHLLSVMQATNMIEEWDRSRSSVLKLKDRLVQLVRGTPTAEQRLNMMVGLLEDRLRVVANEEGTISFVLYWSDARVGKAIVEAAMQTFLDYRHKTDSAAITDSIAILDHSTESLEAELGQTLALLPRSRSTPVGVRPVRQVVPVVLGPSPETTVRFSRTRALLDARQQEVARLEGARAQQLAEAQAKLSAARTIYTAGHPTVLALEQTLAQLSNEPPELAAARREIKALEVEYDALSARVGAETERAEQSRELSQLPATPFIDLTRSPEAADPVGLRLRAQMAELSAVRSRAMAARAELASFEAGFKYKYTIVRPPQLPREPITPDGPAILLAGVLASLLLAVAFAVAADLAGGRVLEAWRLERQLGMPVTLRIPKL